MEGQIDFNVTAKKAIIVNILLIAVLACAFLAGFYYGQHTQYQETQHFFSEYIDSSCSCTANLVEQNGRLVYEKPPLIILPYMFNNSLE